MAARPRRLNAAQATASIQEWIEAERFDNDDDEATGILTSESDSSEFVSGEEVDNVELKNDTSSSAEDETTHDEEPDECISKDKTLTWSSVPLQPPQGRRGKHNLLRERCSVTIDKALLVDPRMCIEHFLDDKFMTTVLQHTNEELQRRRQKRADQQLVCHEVFDLLEMEACIGLLILTGVMSSKGESSELMWSKTFGRPILRATMPLKR